MHRARGDATGRESEYALLSRAVSRPLTLATSLSLAPLALSLTRHSVHRRESRIAAPYTTYTITLRTIHPDSPRRTTEYHLRSTRTGLSPLSHCRLFFFFFSLPSEPRRDVYTGHLRVSYTPTKKKNRNCTTLHLPYGCLFIGVALRNFHSHAVTVCSSVFPIPAFFLLVCVFFLFLFSFCSARDAKQDDVDATATVVRCERTRTERRAAAVEVARLVSPRTAIRPSYTSAAIRAAPSPRRPFSLLLSPAFSHFPLSPRHPSPVVVAQRAFGPWCATPRSFRRCVATPNLSRDAERPVLQERVDVRVLLDFRIRRVHGDDVISIISRDHGERRRGH